MIVTNPNRANLMNGITPCEGPRALSQICDFSLNSDYLFNLTQAQQNGEFSTLQTVFIDNSANTVNAVVTIQGGTGQEIVLGPKQSGYFPILCSTPPIVDVTSPGSTAKVGIIFLNFYIPPFSWTNS